MLQSLRIIKQCLYVAFLLASLFILLHFIHLNLRLFVYRFEVLITKHGLLSDGMFFDPRSKQKFKYDHLRKVLIPCFVSMLVKMPVVLSISLQL